jgi:PilZ domain
MISEPERRLQERYPADFDAKVTNLKEPVCATSGPVVDFSRNGVCLILPVSLAADSSVRLDIAGSILWGRVVYAHLQGMHFRTGVTIQHVQLSGSQLGLTLQSILLDVMPATPGVLASEAYLG